MAEHIVEASREAAFEAFRAEFTQNGWVDLPLSCVHLFLPVFSWDLLPFLQFQRTRGSYQALT